MIKTNDVIIRYNNDWIYFEKPNYIISTNNLNDVLSSFRKIEKLVDDNKWYAAGFVSYEASSAFDPALQTRNQNDFPYLWFGLYNKPKSIKLPNLSYESKNILWEPTVDLNSYNIAFDYIKNLLKEGKTYQVNYSQRMKSNIDLSYTFEYFVYLVQNQNNHAAYINTESYAICSASPELFFQLDNDTIICRPMKGTIKRGFTTFDDEEKINLLKNSLKNKAENLMIVDMVRNDLGRIATKGSVDVPELFNIEKYPTLFQMTSTVTAKTNSSIVDIFKAMFPCASITGAPKVSTMNIIKEIENTPRKIYTGSIGFIAPNRIAKFNVAIRTVLIDRKNKIAEYGAGGGVVWDSTNDDEYSELILKTQILTEVALDFSLLETILWTPKEGFFLIEKHINRIIDSAKYFDYPVSVELIKKKLNEISSDFISPMRVRLLLNKNGSITVEYTQFQNENKNFNIYLAEKPINSNNKYLYHKTTNRLIYENYMKSNTGYDDVLLYNEKNELTEFTKGNLVVEIDGKLFTPPILCGLLAGTYRLSLLETRKIQERIIKVDELNKCKNIYFINSVRKMIKVDLKHSLFNR